MKRDEILNNRGIEFTEAERAQLRAMLEMDRKTAFLWSTIGAAIKWAVIIGGACWAIYQALKDAFKVH